MLAILSLVVFAAGIGLYAVVTNPITWLNVWFPREKPRPEMPEDLRRMTELADRAIAARKAGCPLPAEIEEFRS